MKHLYEIASAPRSSSGEETSSACRMPLRILSNFPRLHAAGRARPELECSPWPSGGGLGAVWTVFLRSFRLDYVVVNGAPAKLMLLAALKTLVPFNRCRLVAVDILLSRPLTRSDRVKAFVRRMLLRRVHRILLYYRHTAEIERTLHLPRDLFDYVPFKINEFTLVMEMTPRDEGYIFCGGKTRRDFDTFLQAVRDLPYPVRIVTTSNDDIARHGSRLDERDLPPQVTVCRLDGSARPFIEAMAGARLVVLPLKPDITGVGIGVYLMAMALGKCVVITAGPSTEGLLTDDLAIVVPPGDPAALKHAIASAYADRDLCRRLGENGRRYALSLGDEGQLMRAILAWIERDASHPDRSRGR